MRRSAEQAVVHVGRPHEAVTRTLAGQAVILTVTNAAGRTAAMTRSAWQAVMRGALGGA
jgi:hypothetical protein